MIRSCLFLVMSLLIITSLIYAQPDHDVLVHSHALRNNDQNSIGQISTFGGSFSNNGWTADRDNAQLRIDLNHFLPPEGTMEITLTNMMPEVTDDWVPISLYSRGDGSFFDVDPSPGSYVMLKSDEKLVNQYNIDFKFISSSFYGEKAPHERRETRINSRNWNSNTDYTFRIIWTTTEIWLTLNGETLARQEFEGQVETFGYIFLGKDDTYGSGNAGVIYKDLKLYKPASNYPFTNIADPSAEMAHQKVGAQGVLISDFDADGASDLYTPHFFAKDYDTENLLFMAQNGGFDELGADRGVNDPSYSYASLAGDFDADGDKDIFVMNYHSSSYPNEPNHLYLNTGTGSFSNATGRLGSNIASDSKGATLTDIEKDGDLDIIVVNGGSPHQMYLNDGNANFTVNTQILQAFRSSGKSYAAVTAGDLDNDGYQDLVICHNDGVDIARNTQNGGYSSMASLTLAAGVNSVSLCDVDNDGDLDMVVGSDAGANSRIEVFQNNNGSFVNISNLGVNSLQTFGLLTGDWNNDGDIDLFGIDKYKPARLYFNDGNGAFAPGSNSGVEAFFADGRGSGVFDVNDDGNLDIYAVARGGITDGKLYSRNHLFRNDYSGSNSFVKVKVVNDNGIAVGLGAKIWVYQAGGLDDANSLLGYREILANNGYQSQSSMVQHVGAGQTASVDVKVELPNGDVRTFESVTTNQTLTVRPVEQVPDQLIRVSPVGTPGAVVGQEVTVTFKVLSADDQPVPAHQVTFDITQGSGDLDQTGNSTLSKTTDQQGLVSVAWMMGTVSGADGQNSLRVSSLQDGLHLAGSPETITVTPQPANPYRLNYVSGDNQTGFINRALSQPIITQITDIYGNPISGHTVQYTIQQGLGACVTDSDTAASVNVQTDNNGYAEVNWQMGPQIGPNALRASSFYNGTELQNSPYTFNASAGEPNRKINYISGNDQIGHISSELDEPLTVKLTDMQDNPVEGENITFIVMSGDGHFSGQDTVQVQTNNQGIAGVTPTLGSSIGDSLYVFHAVVPSAQNSPIVFYASATGGKPTSIVMVSGNQQTSTAGQLLPESFVIQILDTFGNPVRRFDVEFAVTQGGGTIQGLQTVLVETDSDGHASVRLKLGTKAGENVVVATAEDLDGSPVIFTATGNPGPPARIMKVSGDTQSGDAGQPLLQPFKITVTDSFLNTISGHPVTYEVVQGNGTLSGQTRLTRNTDVWGQVAVTYTMGPTEHEQKVAVSSQYEGRDLIGSPLIFTAYTGPGDPYELKYVSGNHQKGRINEPLPEPFKVRIVDQNGIGLEDRPVQFMTFSGARFNGENTITVHTDENGMASVRPTLGTDYGENNYVFEAMARFDGKSLKGSPMQFFASGRKSLAVSMQRVNSDDEFTGQVGTVLPDSLKILVLNDDGNPVSRHPVTFTIESGNCLINGQYTSHNVLSNRHGIAAAQVYLGDAPSTSTIRVTSDDGVDPLKPGTISYTVEALPGEPDSENSSMTATTDILANGQDKSNIVVELKDQFENPLSGLQVTLQASGLEVFIDQPDSPTDANGRIQASVASTNVGAVMVWALVNNQIVVQTEISFINGPPHHVVPFGTDQYYEKEKMLPDPIGLRVLDEWNHPVENVEVTFAIEDGGGSIQENQPVRTDSTGRVSVHWVLGPVLGEQHVRANVTGIPTDTYFMAYASPPADGLVSKQSGDSTIGLINKTMPDSFAVQVTEKNGEPISHISVEFKLLVGEGAWLTLNPVKTDANGMAAVVFKTGTVTGLHKIRATAGSYGSVTFNCYVQSTRTIKLQKLSADVETVRPFSEIPLKIKAMDVFDRVLEAEGIQFDVVKGTGSIQEPLPAFTNNQGIAEVTWQTGNLGAQQVNVQPQNAAIESQVSYTAIVVNSAPEFSPPLPRNLAVEAGQTVNISIRAEDADDDPLHYEFKNMPESATVDTAQNYLFTWTPTMEYEGDYSITFIVRDKFGAADSGTVMIHTSVQNMCPEITLREPEEDVLVIDYNQPLSFKVEASDPNGDAVYYTWMIDDIFAGDTPMLPVVFTKAQFPDSALVVECVVSDNECNTKERWHVHLRTPNAVDLSTFTAESIDNHVVVSWETSREVNTSGFYVLRSANKNSGFTRINPEMIKPNEQGVYSCRDNEVTAGKRYYYKLLEVDRYGYETEYGMAQALIALPTRVALHQNYPNPFNPSTTIRFELPKNVRVELIIYNIRGERVKTLIDRKMNAGIHSIMWNAGSSAGEPVSSGVYYYQLRLDHEKQFTRKLLLLK
ncbi:MAG: Ig-like domain-containing protein [candidate division KSB1 bacterium]|nr:Ig-like domain-containing protein [candidate division KSB1 bacterium]